MLFFNSELTRLPVLTLAVSPSAGEHAGKIGPMLAR